MTQEFFAGQLRLAMVAIIAYCAGAKYFTPEGAGLATALLTTLGPLAAPWLWSIYKNINTVRVNADSKAAAVAAVEKHTDSAAAAVDAIANMPPKV